jgi:TolB-like protein/DNA-binding SARP family transcriptional activator/Tfp pilus assembly protein PilF
MDYSLKFFGGASLEAATGTVTGRAAQRHPLALLALLAASPSRAASRDKLMALLWPERAAEHARGLLHQAVYSLRKSLGEAAVISVGEELRLNTDLVDCDVVSFEEALATGDPERAAGLYVGPFLDGFFLSAAPEFERWVDAERARLADARAGALEALAAAAEEAADHDLAARWWKARAAHDPYDSRVALRLMRALETAGNVPGALQYAAVHERLLERELGIESAPEVAALADRLRRQAATAGRAGGGEAGPSRPARTRSEASAPSQEPPVPVPDSALAAPMEPAPPPSAQPRHRASRYAVSAALVLVVAIGALRFGVGGSGEAPPAPPAEPSIAVLPLANPDPDDEVLAVGMTDELISSLAMAGLRVAPSTSVLAFRGRPSDVRAIGDSLGVEYVLEGTLQRIDARLRVRVRLADARDGSTRWSERYDRELVDVFAVQDEIARAIAGELGLRLGSDRGRALRPPGTPNIAAYELYLRGNDPAMLRSDSAALQALDHFRQAVALDSTYAAAYAGMARMYGRLIKSDAAPMSVREMVALAEQAAMRAVALNDSLAEAHATLGLVRMAAYDLTSAEALLRRAIALDPASARTREWLVGLLLWTGRPEEALEVAARALELEPLSPSANAEYARALMANDRCDEALAQLEGLATLQPPLLRAAPIAAQCYARKEMWEEAIAVLRPQAERERSARALLAYMFARAGRTDDALRVRAEFEERWRRLGRDAYHLAVVDAGFADGDQVLDWLERSLLAGELRPGPGFMGLMDPSFEDVRRDPRFASLHARVTGRHP